MSVSYSQGPARLLVLAFCLALLPSTVLAQVSATRAAAKAESEQHDDSGFSLTGQIGFRVEYISNENFAENVTTFDDDHRMRMRARVRVGGEYSASEYVTLGFRLSTGSGDYPSSGWSTLSDVFRRDLISLDRAYINLMPRENLQLRFGFNSNPLWRPTELVWDGDVSPGGLAQVLRLEKVELVAGQFMLREVRDLRGPRQENSFLFAHGLTYTEGGPLNLKVGAFNYVYANPNAIATALDRGELNSDFQTNRFQPGDPGAFFSDYNILGGSVSLAREGLALVAELALNVAAESDSDLGPAFESKENLAFGVLGTYGQLNQPWDWSLSAGFFHMEADAVIASYNSDDLQQTNVNSVPLFFRLRLPGGANLVWDTYLQKKIDEDLASNGGVIHDENAIKLRTRVTLQANF